MAARKSVVQKYREANTVDPRHTHILIHKDGYWGKGVTEADALLAFNSIVTPTAIPKGAMVWLCTEGTYINGDGGISRPNGDLEQIRIQ